ncbi:hypothetical protein WJX79_001307 [Trebouxia sp. C0005]
MSAAASSKNLGARLWSSYNRQLDARPLVTKSFTSFFGFIVGDGVAQVASGEKYDYWRTARFATYGILVHGPLSHVWYGILDKNVMPRTPKSPAAVVTKMALDQLLLSPIGICLFYSIIKTMEGQSDKITQTLKDKFWPTLLAGYAVWPLAHVINFRFIPNSQRVLYINAVNVCWNVFLCKLASSGPQDESRIKAAGRQQSGGKELKAEV